MRKAGTILILAAFVLVSGCGKSEDDKMKERELNTANMKVHEVQMEKMDQMEHLALRIDSTIAMHDALVAADPRRTAGHTSDDLRTARTELGEATKAMTNWMANFKPYDESVSHEQAMASLRQTAEELNDVTVTMDSAIRNAETALDAHRKFADSLQATARKGKR